MKYNDDIYRLLCKINKRCRDYFFYNKNIGLDYATEKMVDEVIEISKELEKIRKKQIKEIREDNV